ncbi:hypothetical protein [Paraburkholderia fungorum]|uniref:hypothetical protein n=1 Tax=Paraburkholderia fungorum TaxID=134537 RepID=UPI00161F19A6|nr:hypothetical protein [Paraburkholderia fungorum]MBB5547585.1 hypothetical protein [Paraburkholderia fungorum]
MTTITMIISISAVLAGLAALSAGLLNRWYGEHFSTAVDCRKVLEADGKEHDRYSVNGQ